MATQVEVIKEKETDSYRLVIFSGSGTLVLLNREGGRYALPVVSIRKYTRLAKELSALLQEKWQIRSILLFAAQLETKDEPLSYIVAEARNQVQSLAENMDWFPVHQAESQLLQGADSELLQQSCNRAIAPIQKDDAEPFSKLGWLNELTGWIETILTPQGTEITGFQQINGSETFALVRIDTTGKPVWFKAVGEPNLHEYSITLGLAKLFPEFMPRMLGARPDWHGWLMEDSNASKLYDKDDLKLWRTATQALTSLQTASADKIASLEAMGCKRREPVQLARQIEGYIDLLRELMPKQSSTAVPRLSNAELSELQTHLEENCASVETCGVPLALAHGDFTGGNIQVNETRCVFIDWAEAYITHPFVTFEYLLLHLPKQPPESPNWRSILTEDYLQPWREMFGESATAEAFRLTPLFALLLHALPSRGSYFPEQIAEPNFGKYMRSLARRMWKEAQDLSAMNIT